MLMTCACVSFLRRVKVQLPVDCMHVRVPDMKTPVSAKHAYT